MHRQKTLPASGQEKPKSSNVATADASDRSVVMEVHKHGVRGAIRGFDAINTLNIIVVTGSLILVGICILDGKSPLYTLFVGLVVVVLALLITCHDLVHQIIEHHVNNHIAKHPHYTGHPKKTAQPVREGVVVTTVAETRSEA